jgi:putative ABC transport system permease protein
MTQRQRSSIVLQRNRGASGGQLTLTSWYEALLLTVPGAAIGLLAARILLPGTDLLIPYRTTVALAAGATVVLVGGSLPMFRRQLGSLQAPDRTPPRSTSRRVVLEALVLILAAGSVLMLRRRGQIDEPGATPSFDLLLAVAPTIIGIAVGVLVLRAYPLAIRGLSWLGARARGMVAFVGFRRVMQQSRLPVLVILLCISASTYAWVMRSSIAHGQEVSSWQAVGADYSVESYGAGVALPTSIDFAELGPVDQIAFGRFFPRASANVERSRATTEVLAIDAPTYAAMNAGTPGDPLLPGFMLVDPARDVGTETNPIPAIVSPDWPSGLDLAVGDVFTLDLGNMSPVVEVRQVRDRYPDIPPRSRFVVFDLAAIQAFSQFPVAPTVAYIRAHRDARPILRAGLAEQSTSAILTSRYQSLDAVAEDPFVEWAGDTLAVVFWFAALFAAVAAIATPAIASAVRRRDLAYLRTVGADERQSTQMTVIEQLPPLLVGTAAGMATGLLVSRLLDPALTLDVFTGNLVPTGLTVDWPALLVMTLGLFGALGLAVVIFVLVNRRTQLTAVLRIGEE